MENDFEARQNEEIERRVTFLEENVDMDKNDFSKVNWIGVIVIAVASLAMLIWGAYL